MFTARYGLGLYVPFVLLVVFKGLIMHINELCTFLFFCSSNSLRLRFLSHPLLQSPTSLHLSAVVYAQSLLRHKIEDELGCSLLIAIIKLAFTNDKYICSSPPPSPHNKLITTSHASIKPVRHFSPRITRALFI